MGHVRPLLATLGVFLSATACGPAGMPPGVSCTGGTEVTAQQVLRVVADSSAASRPAAVVVRFEDGRPGITDAVLSGPKGTEATCSAPGDITFNVQGSMLSDAALTIRSKRPVRLVVSDEVGRLLGDTMIVALGTPDSTYRTMGRGIE